jgi:hypothetical protein
MVAHYPKIRPSMPMTVFRWLRGMLLRSPKFDIGRPKNAQKPGAKRRARQCLGVAACLALLTAPAMRAQKINRATAVRMEDDPDHKMVGVSCRINAGRRRYICVIDSGATNTIISDRVLKAEGPLVEMITGNGVVRVHQREVSLTIADGLNLKSKAFVQPMMLRGVDILVGQDVLRQFRSVIFNYETRQVEFQR